jgi:dipeptidyl aminopeptidase/acylaminoacyl peptidase
MKRSSFVLLSLLSLLLLSRVAAAADAQPALIPRDLIFGNPDKANPQISPDGTRLAYVAADPQGVLQVWVKSIAKDDAKAVTADKHRGIRQYFWAEDDHTLLYLQDADGDENFHLYGVDLRDGNVRDYTPWQGVRADVVGTSREPKLRSTVLVQMNLRDRKVMDVYRIDLASGAVAFDTENPGDVVGFIADWQLVVRGAQATTADGGTELRVRDSAKAKWKTLAKFGPDENVGFLDFAKDGKTVYLVTSVGHDTARVVAHDLARGTEKELAGSDAVDASDSVIDPDKHVVQAVAFTAGKTEWKVLDASVKDDFAGIAKLAGDAEGSIVNRTRDDKTWVVSVIGDESPPRFYLWDRALKKGTLLFSARPALEGKTLAKIQPVDFDARDGLKLHGYLTLPPGLAPKNLPLVLFVHGGPWYRDQWGWNPYAQWLANRGYAVLQVNFRGSTGYGKKYLNAGDKQWGLAMHTDLLDAVKWAADQGTIDPKRVVIFGGSYGGYSALAGAAFTPDAFVGAVDLFGPSNLFTLLQTIPPYWEAIRALFYKRMGDPQKDKDLLTKASPLYSASKIKIPLLIGQGANDPRVKPAESEQIVSAIEKNKGRVIYVVYSDEGHGFARPENNLDFNARAEAFIGALLGGRVEPMPAGMKDRITGSTAKVKVVGK